jgi:hypothetical protein
MSAKIYHRVGPEPDPQVFSLKDKKHNRFKKQLKTAFTR